MRLYRVGWTPEGIHADRYPLISPLAFVFRKHWPSAGDLLPPGFDCSNGAESAFRSAVLVNEPPVPPWRALR